MRTTLVAVVAMIAVAGIGVGVAAKTGLIGGDFVPSQAQVCAGIDSLDTSAVVGTSSPKRLTCAEATTSLETQANSLGVAVWTNDQTGMRVSVQVVRNQEPPKVSKDSPIVIYDKTFDQLYKDAPQEQRWEFTIPGRADRVRCINMLSTTNPTIIVDMGGSYVMVWVSDADEAEFAMPDELTTPVLELTGATIRAVYGDHAAEV